MFPDARILRQEIGLRGRGRLSDFAEFGPLWARCHKIAQKNRHMADLDVTGAGKVR